MQPSLVLWSIALAAVLLGLAAFLRRAAGRRASRIAPGTLVFLASRTPVLVVWVLGAAGLFALMFQDVVAKGGDGVGNLAALAAFCAVVGLGFAPLTVGPVFMLVRAFRPAPALPLDPGEVLLRESLANHFAGPESRGGKLVLTTRRLGFRPFRFNVQLGTWSVRLDELAGFAFEGQRLLAVRTGAAEPAWLVVPAPRLLAARIEALARLPERDRAAAWPAIAEQVAEGGAIPTPP